MMNYLFKPNQELNNESRELYHRLNANSKYVEKFEKKSRLKEIPNKLKETKNTGNTGYKENYCG